MMKRFVLMMMLVCVAAFGLVSVAMADDAPTEDPKENACYAGGAWEGKCDWPTDAEDEWAWNCGWYYARVIDGRISADQYPEDCGEQVSLVFCFGGDKYYQSLCLYSDDSFSVTLYADDTLVAAYPIGKIGAFPSTYEGYFACEEAAYELYMALYGEDGELSGFSDFDVLAEISDGADGYEEDERSFCVLLISNCGCPGFQNAPTTERRNR